MHNPPPGDGSLIAVCGTSGFFFTLIVFIICLFVDTAAPIHLAIADYWRAKADFVRAKAEALVKKGEKR